MTVQDLLGRLVAALDAAGIPYMVTGSFASSLHSIPRATRDLDVVIFPDREQLERFIDALPPTCYYANREEALDALRRRTQFNIIDHATGWKVDFVIPPFEEFNLEEFERRRLIDVGGLQLSVVSPEDIIIAKLLWARAGESDRQVEDAATVLRVQGMRLEVPYVERWVKRLQLDELWRSVRAKAAS